MKHATHPLFLRRIDSARNMARYYVMALQPTLFGDVSLVRQWGRIGTRGRQKVEFFDDCLQAAAALSRLAAQKSNRGYSANPHEVSPAGAPDPACQPVPFAGKASQMIITTPGTK
ncbi:WGR domain-containing protein [Mesorhizobium sp. CO1-1-7]|uniref:WGR domain-containing protein n=1 Tax=Mesorhizobium sp. CO1-1-7 TaxID=2876632 RepID=UPI00398CBE9F